MPAVVIAHAAIFALSLFIAFLLAYNFRFDLGEPQRDLRWFRALFLPLLAIALPVKMLVFFATGQYRGSWRYVGLRDLLGVISASLVCSFVFLTVYFLAENGWRALTGNLLIDRSAAPMLRQSAVFFLDWAVTIALASAARVVVRFYHEDVQPPSSAKSQRVLLVGAGDTGEAALREVLRTRRARYVCVGFLDDRPEMLHARIHNVEVLGGTGDIRQICEELAVNEVWMATPKAGPREIRELVERCEGLGVQFRTIPAVADLVEGRVRVSQLRDVDIADLLGREPVQLDASRIAAQLRARRVLVTGAGGSIGSEMCRQVAAFEPELLVLLERGENNLFEIERELRRSHPNVPLVACVADITDRPRVGAVFERFRPLVVFHAAAHKHVPMMEHNPGEAIKNNVGGTAVIAQACIDIGVTRMVMISTDKAVNPTSVMGCSKRLAELHVQTLGDTGHTEFITVRFGNVLGSSGSVVPIFKEQIAAGGPVTVTHPDMVRYFMTITEAAQLVLQAGVIGRGGEIYVLHMGDPVRIVDLARDMIALSGLRPDVDIEIRFTGKRPGEKLFEELSFAGEHIADTSHPKIGVWKHVTADRRTIQNGVNDLLMDADTLASAEIIRRMQALVPEYAPENDSAPAAAGSS